MPKGLIEREALLDQLRRWAGESQATGRLVLIGGEAGVGKSSLVGAFARSWGRGRRVLRGACESLTTPRPLAPLLDIAVAEPTLATLVAEAAEPMQMFRALLDCLRSRPGSLLVLEDLHWADDATLDLLRFLGRRLIEVPALVLATYRDDDVGRAHPLRVLLGDLSTAPASRRLSVPTLSRAAVEQLAAGSGLDANLLWCRTGGNPFFLTEVLATGGVGVPASARDAVLARAARLPRTARELLDVVAALHTAADVATLQEVVGSVGDELDRCVDGGLLVVVDGELAFRHELARMAVLSSIPPGRLVELHRTVLHALEAVGAGPAVLSHHAEVPGIGCVPGCGLSEQQPRRRRSGPIGRRRRITSGCFGFCR